MAYRDVESRSSTSGEDPPIPSSRPSPLSSSSSLSPSLPNKDIFSDDSSEKGNENSDKKAEMKEEGEKGEEIVEVDKFVEEGGVEEGEEEGNRSSNACINCFSPIPHFFKTKFRSKEFWKRNWWVILGYIFGGFLLFFFSLLLLVALMFETGLTSRFGLLLWIVVSFALMQIIATGVYFLFPSNRNCNRPNLRRRGICIGVELFLYFWVAEIFLLFLLPSSFLFSTSSYNEVGDINVNVFSPKGQEWFNSVNCNISDALEKARRFLGCSVDVNAVSFYIGGSPYIFRQSGTAAMTIYNNIFFEDLNAYCPTPWLIVHELFHVYQYSRGRYRYGGFQGVKGAYERATVVSNSTREFNEVFFTYFNPEQQASIVGDYSYYILHGYSTNTTLKYFSLLVDPLLTDCAPSS